MMDDLNILFHFQVVSRNSSEADAVSYATLARVLIGDLQNIPCQLQKLADVIGHAM
jgi:hypothetical protein